MDQCILGRILHTFYVKKGVPTLRKILARAKKEIGFTDGRIFEKASHVYLTYDVYIDYLMYEGLPKYYIFIMQ